MKKSISILTVAIIIVLPLILINSCKKDPCKNKNCQNGATCKEYAGSYNSLGQQVTQDGAYCSCLAGFEGESCETKIMDKIVGTYSGLSKCSGNQETWTIKQHNGSNTEFELANTGLLAYLKFGYAFTIDQQTLQSGNITITAHGEGEFENDSLNFTIITSSSGYPTTTCLYKFKKQ